MLIALWCSSPGIITRSVSKIDQCRKDFIYCVKGPLTVEECAQVIKLGEP